jgi:hypothetical protein
MNNSKSIYICFFQLLSPDLSLHPLLHKLNLSIIFWQLEERELILTLLNEHFQHSKLIISRQKAQIPCLFIYLK